MPATTRVPDRPGLWKYRTLRRSRWSLAFSVLFSLGLHALALLGFNDRKPVVKPVRVADEPVIQLVMPDLKEEEIDPVEDLGEEPPTEAPSIAVPLLADVPSIVPIDAFVQPLDFTPALPSNLDSVRLSAIPVNVARNSGAAERLGKIFDVAQLDRQPEPTFRPSPVFPPELRKEYAESAVLLEFIITAKGEVVAPRSLASDHRRFEEAAIRAVEKWRFRPGYKGGRPVNTRTQITIQFRVAIE
jgi:protein TonB